MPYVNEGKTVDKGKLRIFNTDPNSGAYYYDTLLDNFPTVLNQYGWRSAGELDAAYADLNAISSSTRWKDTITVIEAMDRVERAMTNPLLLDRGERPVHERTYVSQERTYGFCDYANPAQPKKKTRAVFYLVEPNLSSDFPTDSYLVARGGELMRASRPTQPHANLGQWLGELRDFGSLFRSGLSTRNPAKIAGGGYLNLQFGWRPFIDDLRRAAEAVLEADDILRKFYEDSAKLNKRNREVILTQETSNSARVAISANPSNYGNSWNSTTISSVVGGISCRFLGGWGSSAPRGSFQLTVTNVVSLRTFAMFEYFAHDPKNFAERQASYAQKARILLGLTLTPDLIWELTPWSWLADWWFDIGGFLSYQVSVQEDSLVARQSGAIVEKKAVGIANCFVSFNSPYTAPSGLYAPNFCTPTFEWNKQRRLPMGPYGFGPTWSLTPSQWAIVGALGLTKAPRTPRF